MDLKNLTIAQAHEALKKGEFTAVELAQAYLDEIEKKDGAINAYREVFVDVLEQAKEADRKIQASRAEGKEFGMLLGIPCAIKDNILIKGRIAGASSKILENYHATYDATVIEKLKAEGVVFLGRTNMDEFAMGGSTENSAYGPTKNPHDLERVPGGTSGGSAAAIAADMALFALGSDTGGSIRQPSSFCGVVGIKPTYGKVSRYGLIAAVSSFDQIGPITKTVEDCKIVLNVIAGTDIQDGTTIADTTYGKKSVGTKKPVIGIPRAFLKIGGLDSGVKKAFLETEVKFKDLGYEIKDIELPLNDYALPVYYILNFAEVSSNMARFDGMRFGLHVDGADGIQDYFESRRAGLGREVIRRILLGTYVLSSGYYDAYYNRANAVRKMITDDFIKAFKDVDIIATPTAPSPAFKIGEKTSDPVAMYLEDIFTVTANITGMPAISVPCGTAEKEGKQLPVGIQLTARHGEENALFEAGTDLES
ncbi:MAG: Asp-tRNA(Asn)/Glu-tRNA(Gln) amidotransferase subunit GatA [Candidatus Pacebacteria bacterium]|nr:Asp-tRNA(Asn)/Glu-tRNA(Gln) amidotransferase subunit GatA [Candidatus Paceibacterota bacterium]